jgi:dynein heavy chain
VARLEKEYHDSTRELDKINNQVAKIEAQLADLAKKLETQLAEKTKLEEETAIMERRLIAADKLINGLSSENKRLENRLDLGRNKIELGGVKFCTQVFIFFLP